MRGDSFIVRASCSADPDKRVHSISVIDPGFPVWGEVGGGGGGGINDPCPRPAPVGVWGSGCSSSIGSREEHITLYFRHQPIFQQVKECMEALVPTVHC